MLPYNGKHVLQDDGEENIYECDWPASSTMIAQKKKYTYYIYCIYIYIYILCIYNMFLEQNRIYALRTSWHKSLM